MCGICGIRRFGEDPITKEQISSMLMDNERRGNHATGLALQNPGGVIAVLKDHVPAWRFVESREYDEFIEANLIPETEIFLGHTRLATQGRPEENENNHPLYTGETAVVHNGMIHNEDSLFRELSMKRSGQVDSDVLRAILDKEGMTIKGLNQLKRITGSAALAAMSSKYPGMLLLARSGSPLVVASTPTQLCWSSEKKTLHMAMRPWVKRHGVWMQPNRTDMAFVTMNNDSAWMFGAVPKEDKLGVSYLEWHQEFKTAWQYSAPVYNVHESYRGHRVRFYSDKKTDVVLCPTCTAVNGKSVFLPLTKAQMEVPLWKLSCKKCKTPLATEPDSKKEN